jgi:hypothetical protein
MNQINTSIINLVHGPELEILKQYGWFLINVSRYVS